MTAVRTLPKPSRKALTALHVISSVGLLGATASSLVLALTAATTGDPQAAGAAYRFIGTSSAVFGIPLSFLALATGIALGRATKWGVVRYRWTAAKLALLVLVILNGALAIGPTTAARIEGSRSEWLLPPVIGATLLLLLTSVVLSVYKPGGRLRRSS
jgi:hypothetical protein